MSSSQILCGPCGYAHISQYAHKWCTTCQDGFCKDCEKMHKETYVSQKHSLISIDDYLRLSTSLSVCKEHGMTYDSYCKTHDIALCPLCVPSQHKTCGDIIPLNDAAKNAKTSTTVTDLEETIAVGLKNIQSIIESTSSENFYQQEKNVKDEIRQLRTQINNHLDEMEKKVVVDLESKLAKYRSKHNELLKHMKESEKLLKHLEEQTTEMKKFASELQIFLGTRQMNKEVYECLKSTSQFNDVDKYNFKIEIDNGVKSLLTENCSFGNIKIEVTKINVQMLQPKIGQAQMHVPKSVDVKLKRAFSLKPTIPDRMLVTGCTILPSGQLLISDHYCKNHILQYNQDGTHVRDIPVSGTPYDTTVIDSERIAVSYCDSTYIEILNIQNGTVEKKIGFNNNTFGLSYQEGKLFVVVKSRGISIAELSGKILNTLNVNVDTAHNVAATKDRIYHSDFINQTVTCFDMNGRQIWKFEDKSVECPFGITIDRNQNVFVVGFYSDNLTLISRDGKTSKTLLTKSDGLYRPKAINFSQDRGELFVCNEFDTKAAVFKVT